MRGYLDRAVTPEDPNDRAQQDAVIARGCHQFAVLHNGTTLAQRESAVRRLRAYERDLCELAANE